MNGPLLLTINHLSMLDVPVVMALCPRQPLVALPKKDYEDAPLGKLVSFLGLDAIYVERDSGANLQALRTIIKRLKAGAAIGIAPEGGRSRTGALIEAKAGAAYLALQSGATVLPIAVWGQEKAIPEFKRLRRPRIYMHIGAPYTIENDPEKTRKENLDRATSDIMLAMVGLLPPEYHGFYATALEQQKDS